MRCCRKADVSPEPTARSADRFKWHQAHASFLEAVFARSAGSGCASLWLMRAVSFDVDRAAGFDVWMEAFATQVIRTPSPRRAPWTDRCPGITSTPGRQGVSGAEYGRRWRVSDGRLSYGPCNGCGERCAPDWPLAESVGCVGRPRSPARSAAPAEGRRRRSATNPIRIPQGGSSGFSPP